MSREQVIAAVVAPLAVGFIILIAGVAIELATAERGPEGFRLLPSLAELFGGDAGVEEAPEPPSVAVAGARPDALGILGGFDTDVNGGAIVPPELDPLDRDESAGIDRHGGAAMAGLLSTGALDAADGGEGAAYGPKGTPVAPPLQAVAEPISLRESIKRRVPSLRSCYERTIKDGSPVAGTLRLRWTIEQDGAVSDVRAAQDTLGHEQLRACVLREVRDWRFAATDAPVTVEYPLEFVRVAR